jgi:hypothetical protein
LRLGGGDAETLLKRSRAIFQACYTIQESERSRRRASAWIMP